MAATESVSTAATRRRRKVFMSQIRKGQGAP
jgi:hypothetical protein